MWFGLCWLEFISLNAKGGGKLVALIVTPWFLFPVMASFLSSSCVLSVSTRLNSRGVPLFAALTIEPLVESELFVRA